MSNLVYVTGVISDFSPKVHDKNVEDINLVCRRVLATKNIPIAPSLLYHTYEKDPRLKKDINWWIDTVYKPFMEQCTYFCYIPCSTLSSNDRFRLENHLWIKLNKGGRIDSGLIFDYLLNNNLANLILGKD